jgi:uncharacterized protein YceK
MCVTSDMKKYSTHFFACAAAALLMSGCASQSSMTTAQSGYSKDGPAAPAEGPADEGVPQVLQTTAGARPGAQLAGYGY